MYTHLDALREGGAAAVVLVMGDPDGNHAIRNAERPLDPLDLAVLQVAPNDAAPLLEGAARAQAAQLTIQGWRKTKTAANVVATIPGTDPAAAPVTLMTPKSGWYSCAAERGGGIAIWIEVAGTSRQPSRAARQPQHRRLQRTRAAPPRARALHLGARREDAANVHTWMHLGASIGSRNGQPAYAASDDELFTVATTTPSPTFSWNAEPSPSATPGFGEARNIGEIGGRFVSFLGGHPYFHSPSDTYDRCIDPESLAKHTDAVEQIIRYMLQ